MNLSDSMDRYLAFRQAKHKKTTWRCDAGDLRRLLAYTGNIKTKDLSKDHLVGYFYGAKGRINAVKATTFNAERGRINTFLTWCADEGLVSGNPMRGIDRRRVGTRERLRLSPDQMIELIDGAPYARDRMVLSLGCNTGLRAHAITALQVRDVDLEHGWLQTYTTKTETQVKLPITADLDRELRRWLGAYQAECGNLHPDWYLVPARVRYGWYITPDGRRDDGHMVLRPTDQMCYQSALRVVHQGLQRIGCDEPGAGLHTLRRSSGRAVFEAGVSDGDARAIHVAKEFLGHTNVSMTETYLGTSHERQALQGRLQGREFLTRKTEGVAAVVSLAEARRRKRG